MKKIASFFSIIIIIFLMAAIVIFGMTLYYNMTDPLIMDKSYNAENVVAEENSDNKEEIENKENNILQDIRNNVNRFISEIFYGEDKEKIGENEIAVLEKNYFYNQLSDNQKIIYTALQKNIDNLMTGNYKIEFGNTFSDVLSEQGGEEELGRDYQTAIEAFTHDYPEIFYIDVNKMYINMETTTKLIGTKYNVYISPQEGETYYQEGFNSYEQVYAAVQTLEAYKNSIVNSLSGNSYQRIKAIHNYLVDNIEYDSDFENPNKYNLYGALIDKKCVCEGYAKAFKYLANAAGFNCEFLQGTSTNSYGNTESHAWNCVEIGNVWYQVDPTWDDPIIIGNGTLSNKSRYRYFLKGTKTMEKDHEIERQFTEEGKVFIFPELSSSDYD